MSKKLNFNKGSLTFRIPEGVIHYGDNKFANLINYSSEDGALKVVKDKDNGLKVFYNYIGNGRCSLNASAAELDNDDAHQVAITWSMENREVILYIDGEQRARCDINISP